MLLNAVCGTTRNHFIQMQEEARRMTQFTSSVTQSNLTASNVTRPASRVPGHFQYQVATTTIKEDFDGDVFDHEAERTALLKWSILPEDSQQVVQGISDVNILSRFKNMLLALREEFGSDGHIFIKTDQRDSYNQRLLLLENEIQGLLKRKIEYSVKDHQGGHRVMDYTVLLNEKENQVVELEKKINNLEERLRRATARELELENHIQQLNADLRRKDDIIRAKNDQVLAEVAASNIFREALNKLKRNIEQNRGQLNGLDRIVVEGVTFPDQLGFDIRADSLVREGNARSSVYTSSSSSTKYRTQIVSLFREFDRLNTSQGITDMDFEKILEGFMVSVPTSRIGQSTISTLEAIKAKESHAKLRQQFAVASQLYKGHIDRIMRENPGLRIDVDKNLIDLLSSERVSIDRIDGGVVFMERFLEKTIEVPVQDTRTKHLLHLFAVELKRLSAKFPKLINEMDVRLTEYFQQELIDVIEVDELDRVVEILKYVPQVVKVQNVYAYSSEKSRKVEFHLRVLVKALLEELEKLRIRTGCVLEIDEGVIGMINQEIMGVVDVDDILKVFRVVPKIVEVEKIIEKIVDRIVEVPQVVPIERVVEKIVEVEKIREVERIVNIPIEIPKVVNNVVERIVPIEKIIEKVVEVPCVRERLVEVVREVPRIVEVDRILEKIVEQDRVIEVERHINHMVPEIVEIRIEVEKIVQVERIIEKIVEVPTFVERIVERIVQVPQIIEVEKIVEKIVDRVEYRVEKEMIPYVQIEHKVVERIIEKPIPIIQREERIVQVPQIVEKIVEVRTIQQEIREVEVIRDRIVVQDRIKEIQKIINIPVTLIQQVEKIVERRIEIPVIHERVVTVPQVITQIVVQRIYQTKIQEVEVSQPIIIYEPKIIEVEKIINHYIDVPRPIKYIEEKIIQVPKVIERIKEVRVIIEKIIQKMVEVPKVVEVERIVQKIVVVPRVIEKIVEIPQIVEVTVEKEIVRENIREVERIVQVPVIQEKLVEIEVVRNIYIEVKEVVEVIRDKVVPIENIVERVVAHQVVNQKIIEVVREIPREIEVERIVTNYVDRQHVVEIERPIVVPVEIPIPVDRIIEKLVPVYETKENIVQVPQIMEKIVEIRNDMIQIKEVQSYVRDVVVDTQIVEVPHERVIIQTMFKEIPTIVEKIVPITTVVQEIITAQQIVEKVVEKTNQIPRVYEVERIVEKLVQVPKIMEIEKIVPQLVRVNEFIQNIVEKIVEVPIVIEKIKEIIRENEKIVQVQTEVTKIVEVERLVERTVFLEKFKEAVRNINHIEQVLQVVDRYQQTPVAIHTKEEHIVEVPHILEKIVEKIVIMPQIVEVLKYVHEIVETEELGVAVGVDVMTHEQKYKLLARNLHTNFDMLIAQLNKLLRSNPAMKGQIELILKFMAELNQFIMFPKVIQVPVERVVEKVVEVEKIVRVPTQDERSIRMELTLSLLVEKLITELKRLKAQNPNMSLQLEDDVRLIFFSQFGDARSPLLNANINDQLKTFSESIHRKFESLGNWTLDHQSMLNSFLQERFVMANIVKNSNLEIEKARAISEKRLEGLRRYKNEKQTYDKFSRQVLDILPRLMATSRNTREGTELVNQLDPIFRDFSQFLQGQVSVISQEPIKALDDLHITDQRVLSYLREKEAEILKLREKLVMGASTIGNGNNQLNERTISQLTIENNNLKREVTELRTKSISSEFTANSEVKLRTLNQEILRLEQENADMRSSLVNTKNQLESKLHFAEAQIERLEVALGNQKIPRTASQARINFNPSSPQSIGFNSPQSHNGAVSFTSTHTSQQFQSGFVNSPVTARFSSTTEEQVSPVTYSNRGGAFQSTSSGLAGSRNSPVPVNVPIHGAQTNYSNSLSAGLTTQNITPDGRASISTNPMLNSGMTNSVSGMGVGGLGASSQFTSSGLPGASYGGLAGTGMNNVAQSGSMSYDHEVRMSNTVGSLSNSQSRERDYNVGSGNMRSSGNNNHRTTGTFGGMEPTTYGNMGGTRPVQLGTNSAGSSVVSSNLRSSLRGSADGDNLSLNTDQD